MKCIGERLRNERDIRGWSQAYVAEKLHLSGSSTYANWEHGSREPNIEMLINLANLYDVSVDYLIGNTNVKSRAIELNLASHQALEDFYSLNKDEQILIKNMIEALLGKSPKQN